MLPMQDKGGEMTEPLVCAIMLTRDRPAMARRAVECFRRQTYGNRFLFILDTGGETHGLTENRDARMMGHSWRPEFQGESIGKLRNRANDALPDRQILIHWDDDDWSHPNRIAEQVALLQSSGADAVGYREMLFWDERKYVARVERERSYDESREGFVNEAWLYRSQSPKPYALGTSLCYWRKTWEAKPFPAVIQPHNPSVNWGEDYEWCRGLKIESQSSFRPQDHGWDFDESPRMIASIHGGNTSPAYQKLECPEWTRVPAWDEYAREAMRL
jgi:glycosyltransferase involved in cell wall biosynthesis